MTSISLVAQPIALITEIVLGMGLMERMVTEMYEELVKALRETREEVRWHPDVAMYVPPYQLSAAVEAIEELSREIDIDNAAMTAMDAAMPRWIPVTERLPEQDGKYLCAVKSFSHYNSKQYRYVDVLVFQDDCFFECGLGTERVTHWMPLPQPPKEE